MIVELGHFCLILSLAVALVQSTLPLYGAQTRNPGLMALAAPAAIAQLLLIGFAFAAPLLWFAWKRAIPQGYGWRLVGLLALAMAAAVLLAARNALGANRDTIEVVHLLGATDAQIARVFQRSIGMDAAGGGAVGLALGVVVVLFLGRRFASLGAGMVDGGAFGWVEWVALAAIPLAGVALAMVTARLSVMHALRKML